jgi:hypothetical protein
MLMDEAFHVRLDLACAAFRVAEDDINELLLFNDVF